MVVCAGHSLHGHLHLERMRAKRHTGVGVDIRHNPPPGRHPAAKGRPAKAHRRHGIAGLRRIFRHNSRHTGQPQQLQAMVRNPADSRRRSQHRGQHSVALEEKERIIHYI